MEEGNVQSPTSHKEDGRHDGRRGIGKDNVLQVNKCGEAYDARVGVEDGKAQSVDKYNEHQGESIAGDGAPVEVVDRIEVEGYAAGEEDDKGIYQ